MKIYKIIISQSEDYKIELEATSKNEAKEKALELFENDFEEFERIHGDFDILSSEEI